MLLKEAKEVASECLPFVTEKQRLAISILLLTADKLCFVQKESDKISHAIKEGLIIELPCKVGDTVYEVNNGDIYEMLVVSFEIDKDCVCAYLSEDIDYGATSYDLSDFGVRVFLTREKAVQAWKERK